MNTKNQGPEVDSGDDGDEDGDCEGGKPRRQLLWWERAALLQKTPPPVLPGAVIPAPAAAGGATAWYHELPPSAAAAKAARRGGGPGASAKKTWGVAGREPVPAPGDVVVVRAASGQVQKVRVVRVLSVEGAVWVASFVWVRGGG